MNVGMFCRRVQEIGFIMVTVSCVAQMGTDRQRMVGDYDFGAIKRLVMELQGEDQGLGNHGSLDTLYLHGKAVTHDVSCNAPVFYAKGSDGTALYLSAHGQWNTPLDLPQGVVIPTYPLGDGVSMEIGIWDRGLPLFSHQEFGGRLHQGDSAEAPITTHMTMVSSIILGSGIKNGSKGVVPLAKGIVHDWRRDRLEVAKLASEGLLLSNHSYGILPDHVPDWYFGKYVEITRDWDRIMALMPYYLMVTSAGNARQQGFNDDPLHGDAADGWDVLLGAAVSKNGLTVGAAQTQGSRLGEWLAYKSAPYSGAGPTDDGRIKPDLVMDGQQVWAASGPDDQDYQAASGTSVSAAKVSGHLLQLQEYFHALYGRYMKASTLKGLVLHTCKDVAAQGPDYVMGWGVLDPMRAAEVLRLNDLSTRIVEDTLRQGEVVELMVVANGMENLEVSLSWTDPVSKTKAVSRVANLADPVLTNDLDVRIRHGDRDYLPWVLDKDRPGDPAAYGDNIVDPFEKISVRPEPQGVYHIQVSHKGHLADGQQQFSLIVSGMGLEDCQAMVPADFDVRPKGLGSVELGWEHPLEGATFQVRFKPRDGTTWNERSSDRNSAVLSGMRVGVPYDFQVRSLCQTGMASAYSPVHSFLITDNGKGAILVPSDMEGLPTIAFPDILLLQNPVKGEIQFNGAVPLPSNYWIFKETGQLVAEGELNSRTIEFGAQASGLYILCLEHSGQKRNLFFYKRPS